jgi:two-component system response regulator AtoC
MVTEGSFREDLFYRIRVVPINIPPLRERPDDIGLLARHYVEEFNKKLNKKIKGFSKEAEEILKKYPWPGNVRELKNIVERVMIPQSIGKVLTPENLPAELKAASPIDIVRDIDKALPPMSGDRIDYQSVVDHLNTEVRRRILQKALDRSNGKKSAAARLLGISRYTLIRELKKIAKEAG